ncbi:attractin [Schistocerca nitens]|uniref:attractin n=1 Tax=Schistocerca nitens TaxID=7011 RepID=UPI002118A284|nr:attractin [Schistocerca nitens]
MAAALQMFLFLFKSKYRRKCVFTSGVFSMIVVYSSVFNLASSTNCTGAQCVNGECVNGTGCVCFDGWQGPSCQFCGGKVRLPDTSGHIHDGHGNYSIDVKCSWLVDAGGIPNTTIRLHLEEFATECGWDHLYIFDGDSVDAPLLAVFSGLMYKDGYTIRKIPEVVAKSGSALLHFYSDVAYNMTGFNISYRFNSCPSRSSAVNCSGHGICIDGVCTCDASYMGEACHIEVCPGNCGDNGECNMESHRCDCHRGFKGDDCSQWEATGYWEVVQPKDFVPVGSASHGAVVWRDSLYIIGGESFHRAEMIYVYDFNGNVWETHHMDSKNVPQPRYGHSAVLFGDKIYVYGGVEESGTISAELWAFDVNAKTWENITVRAEHCNATAPNGSMLCGPLRSAGHTATVVTGRGGKSERMIVIFGYSPHYGYLNTVQEYHFGTREWIIVRTVGYPVNGGYGHSSALDPLTNYIYVYGGFVSESSAQSVLTNRMYSYNPNTHKWLRLADAPSARFLHTATFVSSGLMLVFGGNTHNDTAHSHGARCYSADLLVYDVLCNHWDISDAPHLLRADLARFGHSAVTFEGALYLYGGFDGQMLSDMMRFVPGKCESLTNDTMCESIRFGVKCLWIPHANKCVSLSAENLINFKNYSLCKETTQSSCSDCQDCTSCSNTFGCEWSNESSSCLLRDADRKMQVLPADRCPNRELAECNQLHNCQACTSNTHCHWTYEVPCKAVGNVSVVEPQESVPCGSVCAELTSCYNCTQEECIWCQNEGRCVDKNAYSVSFPYGQCREWTTQQSRCRSPVAGKSSCSFFATCADCREDPACGWCDDGSGTGLGVCLPGGNLRPAQDFPCPPSLWYFTQCPTCQCNGHSTCANGTSLCNQPCANLTRGPHCEQCVHGYYGNPVNGGKCSPCECNDQGTECHPDTGKCFCTTKGIVGDHCERCDTQNHYLGDPTNKGSCFYELTIDYQFTFNLSKKDDRHYTQINFRNSPPKSDVDAEFSITCSVLAKMNLTMKTANNVEKPILTNHNCTSYRYRFNKAEHNFGTLDNVTLTTFYVYVYDFRPPLWIQISFSQYPKLNLQQFFITFSTCFLLLLLVAAILWKIKQKYDMYRRRQRLFVEMEQMASRPFSQVLVEIEQREKLEDSSESISTLRKKKKDSPSPIALEPCCGNRAAVLSLLVRLPTGGEMYTPPGQSAGLAVASALVTLGNPRKVSIDPTGKTEAKAKSRKSLSSQHPDSCI